MPWVLGALAGVGVIGGAGYAWYHLSGAKRVVDVARAGKQRYDETKGSIAEKREKAAVMSAAAKEKATNLSDRLKGRYRATASKEQDADSVDGAGGDTKEDRPPS
ncbi:uncharacterized protein TRAVEDRAFT_26484 [Trametes versicolor FP-101664 SS1]|uniref:uncharacterized protein n=1 Tax=Trametes versicolor (strain FP-101664) TaxID=717944 RepID=UPI0004624A05|nr:uncharacterized protein TRAVEDRAFT_26484 [Trametes versicolor FP-101664 SS1]EIW62997.1 hypothetical protein TRAVEDRAFT_26484 [Trametes versicolor FP-101664 SS1]